MDYPVVINSCESWTVKKAERWRIDAFKLWCWRRLLKVPWTSLDCIFTGSTDAEAEAPVFWSSDANRQFTGKVSDAGKDWGQKEKMASEDEIAGWYQQCNEHELGQTPGDGEGQGGLVCCSPWGCKELDSTGKLNNNKDKHRLSCETLKNSCC